MDGVSTYMLQIAGEFRWYKTYEELLAEVGKETANMALKFVYYNANVYDNPYIRKNLPEYVHKLENQKPTERARNLLGNWFIKAEGDGYIKQTDFKEVSLRDIPLGLPTVRSFDLASTKPHAGNKDPDWTRGVKGTYDKDSGYFYVLDMVSMRDGPAMVQGLIESTAAKDGRDVYISIPVDAGQSGRVVADQKKARLTVLGHKVVLDSTRKGKLARAENFLIALQEGKVFVAPNVFTKEHYTEMEAFDGDKCNGLHDDIVDAMASCYNMLTSGNLIPTIRINTNSTQYKRLGGKTLL
jgi:predicted phage terminase large subunit-like protein